jgi:hypothetical protein
MDQVKPKLILVTHLSEDAVRYAAQKWKGLYSAQKSVQIGRADLSDETRFLLMGDTSAGLGKKLELPQASW